VRLGLDYPEPHCLTVLNQMIAWKWFRGLIGGKPQKALYFVGMKEEEYVYLDPHYVQTAQEDIK
jgi:cysteine protease ATG4